jgi:hypothetical protein
MWRRRSPKPLPARAPGEGPTLVECKTYRTRGHSRSDRNRYRTKEEIEEWKARDPIPRFEAELIAHGIATEADIKSIRDATEAEIAAGHRIRPQRHRSRPHEVTRDVYSQRGRLMSVRELTYAQAIQEALGQAMDTDPSVFLMGEDIGVYGGAFQVTGDLVHRFGEDRVMDAPISELGQAGVAVGAALAGCRPVLEFQFSDFATLAMEQIVNQAAKLRYMLGGKVNVPLVMRFPAGSGTGAAAQHSQSLDAWLAHVPGLKVVQPSTPA